MVASTFIRGAIKILLVSFNIKVERWPYIVSLMQDTSIKMYVFCCALLVTISLP